MSVGTDLKSDLSFGDFRLDRADERLWGPDGPIKLGNKAYRVLSLLAEHEGRLLTKEALFSSVWDGTIVSESALTSVIKELRRALGDESRTPRFIESVYGRGYRFIEPIQSCDDALAATAVQAEPVSRREGRPPLVLVTAFNDDAVRDRHPHLAAGLREEVLSGLARFREIQLVADSRPEGEAGQGHELSDRDYQLSAMLLPDGDGAKVIARAKRLSDGRVVWAETMALKDTGTAAGVDTIVRRIVGAALPAVDEDLFLGLARETQDFYDRYLLAKRQSFTARTYAEARAAADALERIIAERPDFGLAYPPLVRLYNTDFGYTGLGSTGPAERAHALDLAKAGLAADRGHVHAYTVLAFCNLWHDERDLARDCFEQALALNPYNPVRLNEVAAGMLYLGDYERARALFAMSLHLQPFPDDLYYEDRVQLCLLEGDVSELINLIRKMSVQRLWSSLYEALCGEPGNAKLAAWRDWVGARWVTGTPPAQDELERWIAYHHPFEAKARASFVETVHVAFAALEGKGSASS